MKKILFVLVLAAAIIGLSVFSTYAVRRDQFASRRASVDQAWTRVNEAMLSRNDLVPSMLAAINTTASRHRQVADQVRQASSDLQAAASPEATIAASRRLDSSMTALMAATQQDSDLILNHRFFVLQDKWAAATNRIADEQLHFDAAVRDYNNLISPFPNRLFARWAAFSAADNYFANNPAPNTAALIGD